MIACPNCKSPDTVSYWLNKPEPPANRLADGFTFKLMKALYPDAGVCVDCGDMWLRPPGPPLVLALLSKEKQP